MANNTSKSIALEAIQWAMGMYGYYIDARNAIQHFKYVHQKTKKKTLNFGWVAPILVESRW